MRRRDRGAAATWVALLIVPLLVVGALGIDVGLMQVDRQRLQTGADAAALAIATQCSRQVCTSTTNALAAQDMATANAPLVDPAFATVDVIDRVEGYVEVTTTSTREHFFGPVAGIESTQLSATSGARWGYPERGTVVMPLTISWCELVAAVGVGQVLDLSGRVIGLDLPASGLRVPRLGLTATVCPGALLSSLGLTKPGSALGFLAPGPGCGDTYVEVRTWVGQAPRPEAPASCSTRHFSEYLGETVYLPVHSEIRLNSVTRTNQYRVYAFVAVTLHGYNLGNGVVSNPNPCPGSHVEIVNLIPTSVENRCIDATIELELGIDSPSDDFEYGPDAEPIGDPRVELVLPEERP
ncbi:TadE/TadG family type IV pilus assembly protein [Agrococcus jejuensis]|uniref:TadE/TadG family type IV pilus assembly protein n=1 Tax=Agrococcus jejuensis TaxID=399736 RepID=UPI0016423CFB|nr:pilus assembly protein TadG-related protein [Agrococcus jejuensis]